MTILDLHWKRGRGPTTMVQRMYRKAGLNVPKNYYIACRTFRYNYAYFLWIWETDILRISVVCPSNRVNKGHIKIIKLPPALLAIMKVKYP